MNTSEAPRRHMVKNSFRWIERPEQISVLASPACQEILDVVQVSGPSSVRDIASRIGRTQDTLYYHANKLVDVGLLEVAGRRMTNGRPEKLLAVPDPDVRVRYDTSDPLNMDAVTAMVRSMARVAERDFRKGCDSELAVTEGPARNLWAARTIGWLDHDRTEEVIALLQRLAELLLGPDSSNDGQLTALTWILAPIPADGREQE